MSKQMINIQSIKNCNNDIISLKYYLTEIEVSLVDFDLSEFVYGVIIEKYKIINGQEVFVQSEEAKGVTKKVETAYKIIDILAKGTVTPFTLLEMLDEIMPIK